MYVYLLPRLAFSTISGQIMPRMTRHNWYNWHTHAAWMPAAWRTVHGLAGPPQL